MAKKNNQTEILTIPGCYLRARKRRSYLVLSALLILAAGGLVWLFFGSCTQTVTGWAQVVEGYFTDCIVPSSEIGKIELGQTVKVGTSTGEVTFVDSRFVTYSDVVGLYGYSAQRLHISSDETYYYVRANIVTEATGYQKYTIVTDTVTPFKKYFGGE